MKGMWGVGMERGWCVTGGESVLNILGEDWFIVPFEVQSFERGFDGGDIGWVRGWGIVYRVVWGGSFVFWGIFWDCSVVGLEVTLAAFCKDVKA
ncbi:hypothetical protein [Bartonella grahamii]|uniref:hypothetical protein n=1 Tax=Bartonella grahamii TaxID=33045 RepID=UPI002E7C00A7|nr:hypothetical protein [Bartonella grahamii]